MMRLVLLLVIGSTLCSCSAYRNGFICPDSKGVDCQMLSRVDEMVDSGEIETVYMDKKCKDGKCKYQECKGESCAVRVNEPKVGDRVFVRMRTYEPQ